MTVKISRTVVTPNLPCHEGFMYSVLGRRSLGTRFTPTPAMAQENWRAAGFQLRHAVVPSSCRCISFSRIRCLWVCVVGGRRSSFPKPTPVHTTGTNPSGVPRRVPSHTRVQNTIGYLAERLPLRRLWWLFGVDIPESLSISLVISRRSNQPTSSNSPPILDPMPRATPPRSPHPESAQAAASGADSLGLSSDPDPNLRSEPAAATQAAAPSADSLGEGMIEAEAEVTSLSELGSLAVDALNLFVDNQDPPAAAAGAGSDSSKWAGAASEADSGPTLFPPSVIEHEDRDLELEEPFAGPTGLEYSGDTEIHPLDSPTAEGHPAPVDERSLGNTQAKPSPDQDQPVPEETTSASANAPNPADQGESAPAEEELEEFVPPESLIAQASSTPNSPPLPTNNLFDPLGEDEESSAEDAVSEGIAQRIQEQYDLEAALEESARVAGVQPEPADLGVGEAAATGAGKGERDRTRRRGCRAGAKHVAGRENLSYGQTCEYISAQLGDSTYARFGRRFNLPHIPPQVARKQYPEWFGYVLRHSDRWASDSEGELLPVDTITRWATILPELWQFLYTIDPTLLQGMPQPKYRLPRGYWSSDHPFVPLRQVRSAETKVAPPRTVFNSDSKASSSAAPPRVDRSRSAAPKATPGSSSTASASTAGAPWRPTLDRGHTPIVLTPRSQVEAKASKAKAGKSTSKGIESKPKSVAAGPKTKQAAASGAGTSHSSTSKPVPPSPPPNVPPVLSPQVKGSTQVKAGATFVEVPKPSLTPSTSTSTKGSGTKSADRS